MTTFDATVRVHSLVWADIRLDAQHYTSGSVVVRQSLWYCEKPTPSSVSSRLLTTVLAFVVPGRTGPPYAVIGRRAYHMVAGLDEWAGASPGEDSPGEK